MHALSLVRVYQIDLFNHGASMQNQKWNFLGVVVGNGMQINKNGNTSNYGLGLQNGFAGALTGFIVKYTRNLYHPLAINRTVWDLGA
jgi:hypothetical protein